MIHFRGSSAGKCTRELVLRHLKPELFTIPDDKRPFLDAGHYLQEAVEAFLRERLAAPFHLKSEWRESDGMYQGNGWQVTGHVDGVLEAANKLELLEVKAIKHNSFNKLKKASHWKDVYGHYTYQAQTYLHFSALTSQDVSSVAVSDPHYLYGPFKGTHFIYYDRDTSEMMGSLPIEHGSYSIREDMYEPRDESLWNSIIEKFDEAADYINQETAPEDCNAEGFCYFCRRRGSATQLRRVRRVGLDGNDPENHTLSEAIKTIRLLEEDWILPVFKEFKADEIVLEDGTVLKKGDYE